jgi:integrase
VCDQYEKRFIKPGRRTKAAKNMKGLVAVARRAEVPAANGTTMRLEDKPIAGVTKADVEAFREGRRAQIAAAEATRIAEAEAARVAIVALDAATTLVPAALRRRAARKSPRPKAGEVTINRVLGRLRHLFGWAIDEGYLTASPFTANGRTVIKLNHHIEGPRRRRLDGDEERQLLNAAAPHLRALIEAALETGCRKGELLSLQWHQVNLDQDLIALPAEKTKTAEARTVPITTRLKAILEMRRTGPDGKDLPAAAYVFGNEVGNEVKDIKTAWAATCRRAGIADLHFHDLRRECGSRLLESAGVSLHEVRDWLGHQDVATTNTYLATTVSKLQETRRKFDLARIGRTSVAHGSDQPAPASPESHAPDGANRVQ